MTDEFPEYEWYIFRIGGFVREGAHDTTVLYTTDKKVSGRRKTAIEAGAVKRTFPMRLDLLLEGERVFVGNKDYILGDDKGAVHVPAYLLEVIEGKHKGVKYTFLKDG